MLNDAAPAIAESERIQSRIDDIYRARAVIGEDGVSYSITPDSVTPERGAFLRDICRGERATRSLEIGMAWGLSTLFILTALAENGAGPGAHVVTDPFQTERWHGAGRRSVRDAGAEAMVEFHEERSELLLPRLVAANRQFDFIFIDGDHRFDAVFVDFVFVNRLLRPGGVVVFDDVWFDPVYLACCFAESNCGYTLIAQQPERRLSRRPDQGALMCAYRKPSAVVTRDFFHFVPFFDEFALREERRLRKTGMRALIEGDNALARRCFLGALRLQPLRFNTYARLLRTFLPARLARVLTRRKRAAPSTADSLSH